MENARDVAEQMRAEGKGIDPRPVREPRQSARALPRHGAGDLARHEGRDHAFRLGDGHDRHDHGRVALPEGEESRRSRSSVRSRRRARRSPASASGRRPTCRRIFDRARVDRIELVSQAEAEAMTRRLASEEGIFCGISAGRRVRGRAAHLARGRARDDRVRRLRSRRPLPVDRRVSRLKLDPWRSRGANDADPRLRHRDRCRTSPDCGARATARRSVRRRRARLVRAAAPRPDRQRFRCRSICRRSSPSPARCATGTGLKIASVGNPADPEPELIRRFFDLVDSYVPQLVSWNGGGFDLPVLNHRALIHGVTAAKYWELGRRRPRLPLQQLPRALSHAAPRPDGRARDVPAARVGRARRDGAPLRLSRASSGWTAARSTRLCSRASSSWSAVTARPT